MYSIAISTECVADLPKKMFKQYGVEIIYYDIETDSGVFRDTEEINAGNVMEYFHSGGGIARSITPSAYDYKNFFKKVLMDYDEIIHLCNSQKISNALKNADLARMKLGIEGRKVHVVDSMHLSSGLGLMVLAAAKCRNSGMKVSEILEYLKQEVNYVSTSFLVKNTDFLLQNNRVGRHLMSLCKLLHLHPVICMRNGELHMWKFYVGTYEKAVYKYISDVLYEISDVDKELCVLTYVGCSHESLERIYGEIVRRINFKQVWVQPASATVSCNCGPDCFGIFHYINREEDT